MGDPTEEPTEEPTTQPSAEPTTTTSVEDTDSPTTMTTSTTPAPTMHSAKKWAMIHPGYDGGDGELLWHIYYGDYSDDARFDAFRESHLWDADVVRPFLVRDLKYGRMDERELAILHMSKLSEKVASAPKSEGSSWWTVVIFLVMVALAGGLWIKYSETKVLGGFEGEISRWRDVLGSNLAFATAKLLSPVEAKSLLNRGRNPANPEDYIDLQ